MYKFIIRPIFFAFDPEWVHYFTLNLLKLICKIPFIKSIIRFFYQYSGNNIEKELFGIKFKNPVGLAAGFDKNGKYITELSSFGFSFIEVGTVTPKSQIGNPKKRLFRLKKDEAIINRLGINNDGVDVIVQRLKNNNSKVIIGGNIGKNSATKNENAEQDYIENFKKLHPYVDYFALNVSCPNVSNFTKLQDVEFLKKLVPELNKINASQKKRKPILIKISPDLNRSQLDQTIELIKKEKLDGIIATNTTTKRNQLKTDSNEIEKTEMDVKTFQFLLKNSVELKNFIHNPTLSLENQNVDLWLAPKSTDRRHSTFPLSYGFAGVTMRCPMKNNVD